MVDIVTWYTFKPSKGEKNDEPSLTIDDGYEDLESMVHRIIRGDIPSIRAQQQVYEFGDDSSVKDSDFDSPVVDGLDDLTDIDVSSKIISSATASARAGTPAVAEGDKHGASEVDDKHGVSEEVTADDEGMSKVNE